jgi:ribosomal protein S19E (S16A)
MSDDTMCHKRSTRVRSSTGTTDEESDAASNWWGARAAARLRSLVAVDDGDAPRERPASEPEPHDRAGSEPAEAEGADDADDEREREPEREEPILAGD